MSSFLLTLSLAWRVVIRNWVIYRKEFIANISPTLADPALMLSALGVGLSPFIGQIHGLTYAQYLAPGLVATTALFTAFFECSYGFYVRLNYENIFKAMLTTPIGVKEIVLGEFLWVFLRAGLMALGVGLVLLVLGLLPNPWAIVAFPFLGGLLSLPCGAIGLLASSFVRNINQFQTIYSFLISPMYFLSGVFFPLDGHPVLFGLVQISPFYHGVSLLQSVGWGRYDFGEIAYHIGMLLLFALVLGLWALARIRRKLIS